MSYRYSSRYEAEDRRSRGYESAPSSLFRPNTPPAAPPWYRFVAGVGVVFISCYASPRFLSSFTGKTLLFFARCLAYDEDNNVARCFRQAFESSMMAFAPALPTSRSRDDSFPRPQVAGRTMYNAVQQHHPRLLPERRALRGNELPEEDQYYTRTGSQAVPVTAKDYRAEAQHHAQLRSSKLQESEYFYRAGHQDSGDKLSFEAKKHGDLMKEASKKAAEIILRPQQPDMTGILDVQDLSAAEAVEVVRDFLLKQSIARRFTEVEIIIGTEHHSEASEVRLKPTIERLIKRLDFPFHRSPHSNKAIVVEMLAGDQLF